jgi:hypothetical protein
MDFQLKPLLSPVFLVSMFFFVLISRPKIFSYKSLETDWATRIATVVVVVIAVGAVVTLRHRRK